MEYVGSELWKNIEYCNDIEQLHCMAKYIDGAVDFHKMNNDEENFNFFSLAQEHWKTKVSVTIRKSEVVKV